MRSGWIASWTASRAAVPITKKNSSPIGLNMAAGTARARNNRAPARSRNRTSRIIVSPTVTYQLSIDLEYNQLPSAPMATAARAPAATAAGRHWFRCRTSDPPVLDRCG